MAADGCVLVTGASRGLGFAIAQRLQRDGFQVIGISRKAPARDFPGKFFEADLGSVDQAQRVFSEVSSRFDITGLVNNVGHVVPEKLGEIDLEQMAALFDLNLRTAVQATQTVLPNMRSRGHGRIINISSVTVLGFPERSSYAASKAALSSFTRTWALELATSGITVNAIAPGPTETELFRANSPVGSPGEARYMANIPMRRFGRPAEIGAVASFLMGEDSGYITGQTIFVDGGASIGRSYL